MTRQSGQTQIVRLENVADMAEILADVIIIGGGPAGLTIAKELAATALRVVVLESGLIEEGPDHGALCEVESVGEPFNDAQKAMRENFHGRQAAQWSQAQQPYGVRCRALGGATHAWAGKSAPFDPIDFQYRPWVAHSGWPVTHQDIQPYIRRAETTLNLSPVAPPAKVETGVLNSFYWQFARSRLDSLDIMRFSSEFRKDIPANVQVVLDATVSEIRLTPDGSRFDCVEVKGLCGKTVIVRGRAAVLATGGIENPRLLLASHGQHAAGLGNGYDQVGRYLMDHPGARVGQFGANDIAAITRAFGFVGMPYDGHMHMFMHGLAVDPALQAREELLNSAVYFMPQRAPDDPWDALKRLLKRNSEHPAQDIMSIIGGARLVAAGLGTKLLSHPRMPKAIKSLIVDAAIRLNPNFVVEEYEAGGLPHKLTGMAIDAITEQEPNPDSRIILSRTVDRLGIPKARVDWRISSRDREALARVARICATLLPARGLPQPVLEPWVLDGAPDDALIIDMAHTSGTTRMSDSPRTGVVDKNCQVHGVAGLYVAGSSVFTTSGHANPTLMILAFAIRLADHLKREISAG